MKRQKQIILISCMTIVISLLLIVTSTMALFSDKKTISNHLQAGKLKVTFVRESLTVKSLNDKGLFEEWKNPSEKDFTNTTNENIFDINESSIIAPESKYEAVMRLENKGDVACLYYIEVVITEGKETALASQIKVTLTKNEKEIKEGYLKDGLMFGSKTSGVGTILKGASEKFSVKIEFEDLASDQNNNAQNQNLKFDIIVYAIQVA